MAPFEHLHGFIPKSLKPYLMVLVSFRPWFENLVPLSDQNEQKTDRQITKVRCHLGND